MKDEFITVAIFLLLIGLFGWNSYAVNKKSEKITELIVRLESKENITSEDWEKLKDEWKKEQKILLYFVPHENIKQIDECVRMFCEYTVEKKRGPAMYFLKKARCLLADLANREKIRLDNIF